MLLSQTLCVATGQVRTKGQTPSSRKPQACHLRQKSVVAAFGICKPGEDRKAGCEQTEPDSPEPHASVERRPSRSQEHENESDEENQNLIFAEWVLHTFEPPQVVLLTHWVTYNDSFDAFPLDFVHHFLDGHPNRPQPAGHFFTGITAMRQAHAWDAYGRRNYGSIRVTITAQQAKDTSQ